jgi:hypothetical protein
MFQIPLHHNDVIFWDNGYIIQEDEFFSGL